MATPIAWRAAFLGFTARKRFQWVVHWPLVLILRKALLHQFLKPDSRKFARLEAPIT